MRHALALLPFALAACSMPSALLPEAPLTVPESSGYTRTSSHGEVMDFLRAVNAVHDRRVVITRFGVTPEGREQPLVIISDPPAATPEEARALGRPIVFVMANIHAGEVEGKEVCLQLLREVVWGDEPWPVDKVVVLLAPIYNADGNDRFGPKNRPLQQGPSLSGKRESSRGLDLNRDGMKLENLEARNLARLFAEWDPHVFVDLHTTNGSAHGYELTYAPPLSPSTHPDILAAAENEWLPALRTRVRERHGFETFDYGNFLSDGPEWFQDAPDAIKGWRSFDHRPRFGTNAFGLRNRISILSESYAYADFKTRIDVTRAFVTEILRYAAEQGRRLPELCARADAETAAQGGDGLLLQHTRAELTSRGNEPLLVRGFEQGKDPATGEEWRVAAGPRTTVTVPMFVKFRAAEEVKAPRAYVLGPELAGVAALLRAHGVMVEDLPTGLTADFGHFRLESATRAATAFQGHHERSARWQQRTERIAAPPNSFRVDMSQPLARLIFQLVDPRADDGCLTWNFYDRWLDSGPGTDLPLWIEQ
jgi:hypothetical protein